MKHSNIINFYIIGIITVIITVINFILTLYILYLYNIIDIMGIISLDYSCHEDISINKSIIVYKEETSDKLNYLQKVLDLLSNKQGNYTFKPRFNKLTMSCIEYNIPITNIHTDINRHIPLTIKYLGLYNEWNDFLINENTVLKYEYGKIIQENIRWNNEINGLLDYVAKIYR
jgi:hypothetical protein